MERDWVGHGLMLCCMPGHWELWGGCLSGGECSSVRGAHGSLLIWRILERAAYVPQVIIFFKENFSTSLDSLL